MLLLELNDGTIIGVTDHDEDLEFDIGDGLETYQSGTGILTSDVAMSASLDADNYEVRGPLTDDVITLEGVMGGRLNRARARLFQVNWKSLADGALKLLAGSVSEARVENGEFVLSVRSDMDKYNQPVGRLITNNCDADYGDARCGATPETVTGTVTSVIDAMRFTVSYTGSFADDFFNKGLVFPLTGDLAGTQPVEIEDWTVGGAIVTFTPLVEAPGVGDTFTVQRGCPKSRADCMARNNIINFRGYPELPGSDQILRVTIPGQGNEDD